MGTAARRTAAGLAVVTAGLLASGATVPVYDGVGTPDEPYRYVGGTPAPGSATATVTPEGDLRLNTGESGPQALVDAGAGTLTGTPPITVTLAAVATDVVPPRVTVDGAAYRVTATGSARVDPSGRAGFVFLRAAVMTEPPPVVVHRLGTSGPWQEVPTTRAARDVLSTPFAALGDYAVVRLPGAKPIDGSSIGIGRIALLAAGVLLLLGITLGALRRPKDQPEGQPERQPPR